MRPRADHGEATYRGASRLEGRNALITGADSGIGRAVALAFAREGAEVAISYLSEETDARETERLVTEAGRRAALLPGDIGEAAVCETYEQFEDVPDRADPLLIRPPSSHSIRVQIASPMLQPRLLLSASLAR